MNAPLAASLFGAVDLAPRDPILGVTEAFNADPNPRKVNLGVGVYCDDNGKVPLLECVKRAEREMTDKAAPRGYLPIDGIPAYDQAVQALLFGDDSEVIASGRAVTVQALGGTGGLKVGADFLRRFAPGVAGLDQRSRAGRTTARCSRAPASPSTPIRTTTRPRTASISTAMLRRARRDARRQRSSCCTRAATTPPGVDPTPAQWDEIVDAFARAAWCRSSTSPTRDSATASMPMARSCASSSPRPAPLFIVELVLQVVLALRRARRRADRRRRRQGRGRARAVAAEARRARQLLESADAWRPDRRAWC